MAFTQISDPRLAFAFWSGVAALLLTLALGVQIMIMRERLQRRLAREKRVVERWRPLLTAAIVGAPVLHMPRLAKRDRVAFLKMWIHMHASLRGSSSRELNRIAEQVGVAAFARQLLEGRDRGSALLATLALGYLRDEGAWDALVERALLRDSVASLNAVWALMQAAPARAAPDVVPLAIAREDWPAAQVVNILQEGGGHGKAALIAVLPTLDAVPLVRALRLAEGMQANLPPDLIEHFLGHADHAVLAAALRLADAPVLLPAVRGFTTHADWELRVQAAKALRRLGGRSEIPVLQAMLSDPHWWVRYRAAQSLAALPFVRRSDIEAMIANSEDAYAAGVLRQVLAEEASA